MSACVDGKTKVINGELHRCVKGEWVAVIGYGYAHTSDSDDAPDSTDPRGEDPVDSDGRRR